MDIMGELLASQNKKFTAINRGQQVEGEVVSISNKEIILDLGAKSEGVLQKRELSESQIKDLKLGDKLKSYVSQSENESGQIVLSSSYQIKSSSSFAGRGRGTRPYSLKRAISGDKFIQAQNKKTKLQGKVLEVNKGGLIVEVEGARGFLPNSQVGFELMNKAGGGMESLIGQNLTLVVIEVDWVNNKLIFTQRGQVSQDVKSKLREFKKDQKAEGKIVAVLPFGLVVSVIDRSVSGGDVAGVEGLVFISDIAWEKVEDISNIFKVGQSIQIVIIGIDEELGRLNLSIKQLKVDPFVKIADKYLPDEVVKGEIVSVTDTGITVKLEMGVEGFLPSAKMDPDTDYEVGKDVTLLIDNVDANRRKINLAPFVTSTKDLIYK